MIGTQFDDTPLKNHVTATDEPGWRIVERENNTRYFEVFKTLHHTFLEVAEKQRLPDGGLVMPMPPASMLKTAP
jgi:hypothetical protein